MKKVQLIKMGMDFDGEDKKWNMGNHRLRVQVINEAPTDAEKKCGGISFTDKDGHVVAGDFQFYRGNKSHPDALGWDFDDHGVDGEDCRVYRGLDGFFWHTLEPTTANIKMLLEHMLDDEVEIVGVK